MGLGQGNIEISVRGGVPLTRPNSTQLVSMTRVWLFCSHTRRQKSPTVWGRGPWVAMNSRGLQRP